MHTHIHSKNVTILLSSSKHVVIHFDLKSIESKASEAAPFYIVGLRFGSLYPFSQSRLHVDLYCILLQV